MQPFFIVGDEIAQLHQPHAGFNFLNGHILARIFGAERHLPIGADSFDLHTPAPDAFMKNLLCHESTILRMIFQNAIPVTREPEKIRQNWGASDSRTTYS